MQKVVRFKNGSRLIDLHTLIRDTLGVEMPVAAVVIITIGSLIAMLKGDSSG